MGVQEISNRDHQVIIKGIGRPSNEATETKIDERLLPRMVSG